MRLLLALAMMLAATLAVLLGDSTPSLSAVPTGCAVVTATPDGFLAVRSGPAAEYPEIERLKPGQVVYAAAPTSLHPWQEIDRLVEIINGKARVVRDIGGYAHGRYLRRVDC
jgi:hypothetical protein